jgi:hypothetical protein
MIYGDAAKDKLTPDTYAIRQSLNLYTYCVNDPISFVDRNGEFIEQVNALYVGPMMGLNKEINVSIFEVEASWGFVKFRGFDITARLLQDGAEVASKSGTEFPMSLSSGTSGKTSYWSVSIDGTYGNQSVSWSTDRVLFNKVGMRYPRYKDYLSGLSIFEPSTTLTKVSNPVKWTTADRDKYKKWYEQTYANGDVLDWSKVQVHHIIPRAYGGTNDYSNLMPLPFEVHLLYNRWWANY